MAYDDQGREKRGIDSDWHVVQRDFDAVDRVIRATDALGLWRDYQYDMGVGFLEMSRLLRCAISTGYDVGPSRRQHRYEFLELDYGSNRSSRRPLIAR